MLRCLRAAAWQVAQTLDLARLLAGVLRGAVPLDLRLALKQVLVLHAEVLLRVVRAPLLR